MLLLIFSCFLIGVCIGDEPRCPQVDFDKSLMEMLVRLELKMNQTNDKLEETVKQTNDKLAVLEEMVKKETDERNDMMNPLTETVQDLRKEIEPMKQKSRQIDTRVVKVEQNITVPWVYFLVTDPEAKLIGSRPIFTKVIHNVGDSYNVSTGIFTCRFPGLYQFAFTFLTKTNHACYTNLNNVVQVKSQGSDQPDSTTMVTFMYLSIGDNVVVTCSETYTTSGWVWFTGTMVRA